MLALCTNWIMEPFGISTPKYVLGNTGKFKTAKGEKQPHSFTFEKVKIKFFFSSSPNQLQSVFFFLPFLLRIQHYGIHLCCY